MQKGQTLNHYEIIEKLGQGGIGDVYRARDTKLGRDVALKVLPETLTADPARHARFHREAQLLAAFEHPHVASIYSLEDDGDIHFLVLELVEGEDLSTRLQRGPIPPDEAMEVARQVAEALEAAHAKDIIHRDLKPANIKLTPAGQAMVLDFGLAKVREDSAAQDDQTILSDSPTIAPDMTREGTVLGTAAYMSPEQARGHQVDERTDIWAFGCVFYEMLTGKAAFRGDSVSDILASVLRSEPDPASLPAALPVAVRRLLRRCLRKDKKQRLHHIADARIAIEDTLVENDPSGISDLSAFGAVMANDSTLSTATAGGGRRPWPMVLAVLGWLTAIALAIVLWPQNTIQHQPTRLDSLTFSGRDWAPDASPDGSMIAFVSDRDGHHSRIWLKQLSGGAEAPLTVGPDDLPRFSPDGSQVLFVRDEGGVRNLYRQSVVGGQPRKLLGDVLEADWSPDGTEVAFIRMASEDGDNLFYVGAADVQTGHERILTRILNRTSYGIRWAPDGQYIALCLTSLTGNVAEASSLSLIDSETGVVERLEITNWWGPFTAPDWSPSGRSLVVGQAADVLAHVSDSPCQVMEYDLDSDQTRPLFWLPLRLPRGGWGFSSLAILDTDRLVIDEETGLAELHEYSIEDGTVSATPKVLTRSLGRDRQPAYSPDGKQIVFSSNRNGNIDLWTLDRTTGVIHQLTDDPSDDWDPAFTPDGQRVLWSSSRSGSLEIWGANADGSQARQITQDGVDAENPTMTRDGQWIVYSSNNDTKRGIWKIRPDGSEATRIVDVSSLLPEVSPDGRHALYVVFHSLNFQVRVVEIETGRVVPFVIDVATVERHQTVTFGRARWSADGSAIIFVSQNQDGDIGLHIQDFSPELDTLDSRRELMGFGSITAVESMGLSPDGRSLTVSATSQRLVLKLASHVGLEGWSGR